MDLSVIIVSYNVSSFLDQTLATLSEAVNGLSTEVYVVDNDSHDDSVAMVRRKYPWVKLIESGSNLGFARGNNLALEKSQGRYVLLLNPDTVLRTDTLTTMIDFLDTHPEAGAAGCKVLNPDGSLQLACRRGFPSPGMALYKMIGLSGLFPKSRTFGAYNLTYLDPEVVSEVDALSGSFMMLRKEALDQAGFLDGDFFMYGEDLDLCYRIKQAGWKIYYVPNTEIIHFKGESAKTVPTRKSVRDFYTAMHIFVGKHYRKGSKKYMPQWLVIAGIYASMGVVYCVRMLRRMWQPVLDLVLLNISLVLGIVLRFGLKLEEAPAYSRLQWLSIFVVYSMLYMVTFFFTGMYHRYRNDPDRSLIGIFIGFLFNVFIVNFIKEYNFSRIASFYCWGFNTILVSGWRFLYQVNAGRKEHGAGESAVVVGRLEDAVFVRDSLARDEHFISEVIGCVESSKDAIRGRELSGLHVLGLVEDLGDIISEYRVQTVLIAGSSVPFADVLRAGSKFGVMRPEFKLIPELNCNGNVENMNNAVLTLIDIKPS